MKKCTQCKEIKSINKFGIRNKVKNIRHEWCRICLNSYAKKYREQNQQKIKVGQKKYYEEKGRELKKIYDKKHLARSREKERLRYQTDSNFRMKKILRSRFAKVLRGQKKSNSLIEYLGADLPFIRKWIAFQFDDNMSWKNQGKYWHIDHVIPCNSFDLSIEEDRYKCFHWRNLRPLEGSENDSKSDKIIPSEIKNHKKIVINFEIFYIFGTK